MARLPRQISGWLVLGTHVFGFMGAPGLHYWLVSTDSNPQTLLAGYCHACCDDSHHTTSSPADDSAPDRPRKHHDPDHCLLCKFFVNAKSLPVAILQVQHSVACEEFATSEPELVFLEPARAYLSRGPPLA